MKKVLYTVCVDDYFPELCEITFPNLRAYADKIGAEHHIIRDRKYPGFPPTYEKLQVHELGKYNDWNILIDADAMIHPQMWDVTEKIPKDHVGFHAGFEAHYLFKKDPYFLRDGRNRGVSANFLVSHAWCHDFWTPLEFGWDVAESRTERNHIVDEYCLSRNLAKFGLKWTGVLESYQQHLFQHFGAQDQDKPTQEEMVSQAKWLTHEWSKL